MPTFDRPPISLLANASATGNPKSVQAGTYVFACSGTFNSGSAKLQILGPDGSTYIDVGNEAIMLAASSCIVDLPDCTVRAALTGAPSAMFANLTAQRA